MISVWLLLSWFHKIIALSFCIVILLVLTNLLHKDSVQNTNKHQKRYHSKTKKNGISSWIIYLSVTGILFYCISLISLLIGDIIINSVYWFGIPYSITSLSWATANCCVYFLFMKRIRVIFKPTVYSSPISTYVIITVFIVIYFSCELIFCALEFYDIFANGNKQHIQGIDDRLKFKIESYVAIVEICADIIVSWSLTITFARKLSLITLAVVDTAQLHDRHMSQKYAIQSSSMEIELETGEEKEMKEEEFKDNNKSLLNILKSNSTQSTLSSNSFIRSLPFMNSRSSAIKKKISSDININDNQITLLNIIIKQTILASFSTMSTQLWLLYYVPLVFVWSGNTASYHTLYAMHVVSELLVVIDICINVISIMLAFNFSAIYYRNVCGCCHKMCLVACRNLTKMIIVQRVIRYNNTELEIENKSNNCLTTHLLGVK